MQCIKVAITTIVRHTYVIVDYLSLLNFDVRYKIVVSTWLWSIVNMALFPRLVTLSKFWYGFIYLFKYSIASVHHGLYSHIIVIFFQICSVVSESNQTNKFFLFIILSTDYRWRKKDSSVVLYYLFINTPMKWAWNEMSFQIPNAKDWHLIAQSSSVNFTRP